MQCVNFLTSFPSHLPFPPQRRVMELKRASLILNTPPVTPRNSLLLTVPHSASGSGGERMFDLQEFLKHDSGDVRQSIIEVDEPEHQLAHQQVFHSQGSGMSLSQHSDARSVELKSGNLSQYSDARSMELNLEGNTNNSNSHDTAVIMVESRDGPHNESLMSMDDIIAEFDAGLDITVSDGPPAERVSDKQPASPPTCTSDSPVMSLEGDTQGSVSCSQQPNPATSFLLTHHHRRQHSRSFNSGLDEIHGEMEGSTGIRQLPKSQSNEVLQDTGKKGKAKSSWKGRWKPGGGDSKKNKKKKQQDLHRSSETFPRNKDKSLKPPSGRPRGPKLVFEPRGPLFGGGELESRKRSSSSSTELGTRSSSQVEAAAERSRVGATKRHSLQHVSEGGDELSLVDMLRSLSPEPGEESYWQEYGNI